MRLLAWIPVTSFQGSGSGTACSVAAALAPAGLTALLQVNHPVPARAARRVLGFGFWQFLGWKETRREEAPVPRPNPPRAHPARLSPILCSSSGLGTASSRRAGNKPTPVLAVNQPHSFPAQHPDPGRGNRLWAKAPTTQGSDQYKLVLSSQSPQPSRDGAPTVSIGLQCWCSEVAQSPCSTRAVTYCHEDFIHIHRCLCRRLHEQQAVVICICLCILQTITLEC